MSTRRHFILNCTALALAVAASPSLAVAVPLPKRDAAADPLSLATFKASLNKQFLVSTPNGGSVELVLLKAEELVFKSAKPNQKDAGNEKFRLLFQGPLTGALTQDTYSFENANIGQLDIFITPVKSKDQTHCHYEAIFNRAPVNLVK